MRAVQKLVKVLIRWRIGVGRVKPMEHLGDNRAPLWDYVKSHNCKNILEIGLGTGENAKTILSLAPNCEYFIFDNLSDKRSQGAYDELRLRKNVHFYIGDSKETLSKVAENLPKMNLIFIDGGHDYETVKSDWENSKQLMHNGTACFFHNYDLFDVWRVVRKVGDGFSVKTIVPKSGYPFALVRRRRE